jgi:hypothetical protein
MKRLALLAGLTALTLATPARAADCPNWDTDCKAKQQQQGTPNTGPPPECTGYGGSKPDYCKQWENWSPGQGTPGQQGGQPGTWTPPPGQQQPPPGQRPPPPGQQTTQKCPPGYVMLRYGQRWRCVPRRDTSQQQGGNNQGSNQGQRCGYGKVWSDRLYRCVPFRTGGGTDGGNRDSGNRGGYNCGPDERWSQSRYRCVPRRGGDSGGTYGGSSGGGTYGSGGSGGINIYIGGNKKKRRGDDDYNRRGGSDYGNRGGGDYGGNRNKRY